MNSGSLRLRLGTRRSPLALYQARTVIGLLIDRWPGLEVDLSSFSTEGDRKGAVPLTRMSGRGVFTSDLADRLRKSEIDLAVHSLKDLPTEPDLGLGIVAIPLRDDPRECLISRDRVELRDLPEGALVGTSSARREAQLRALRPGLKFAPIRGNVETRIRKVLEERLYDATLLAAAGVRRLGLEDRVTEWFSLDTILPAPGQGAVAVQCRTEDRKIWEILSAIDDFVVRGAVDLERDFLLELGGGCSLPIAAFAETRSGESGTHYFLRGSVFSPDGRKSIVLTSGGSTEEKTAKDLARSALLKGALQLFSVSERGKSLGGRRIVVTRSAHQAGYLNQRLENLGAEVVELPMIRIVKADKTPELLKCIANLKTYDWFFFTSANAVVNWWNMIPDTGELLEREGIRLAAIGPSTADALRKKGCHPDVLPKDFIGEELGKCLGGFSKQRCFLPRGDRASNQLPEMLRLKGALVDCATVYRTLPVSTGQSRIENLMRGIDVVTFTSGSTVENFLKNLATHPKGRVLIANCRIACIGPVTAGVAVKLGLNVDIVARNFTVEGLVEALVEYYKQG